MFSFFRNNCFEVLLILMKPSPFITSWIVPLVQYLKSHHLTQGHLAYLLFIFWKFNDFEFHIQGCDPLSVNFFKGVSIVYRLLLFLALECLIAATSFVEKIYYSFRWKTFVLVRNIIVSIQCFHLFSCSVMSDSFVTPWNLPGSCVHGIFQARILE